MIACFPPERRDGRSSFSDLTHYQADARKTHGDVWSVNLLGDGADEWAAEMAATAHMNPRVKDAAVHVIASWPEGERPTAEQARESGEMIARELGFDAGPGGHQLVIAVHYDTSNTHIHVGVNRVHPVSWRSTHMEWSDLALSRACRRIEYRHGWCEDRGLMEFARLPDGSIATTDRGDPIILASHYRNPGRVRSKAAQMEAATGEYSFERYVRESVVARIRDASRTGEWQAVHRTAAEHGVELRKQGGGFVVACVSGIEVATKASTVGLKAREWKALGEYRSVQFKRDAIKVRKSYDPHGRLGYRDHEVEDRAGQREAVDAAAHARSPRRTRHTEEGRAANERSRHQRAEERRELRVVWRAEDAKRRAALGDQRQAALAALRDRHRQERMELGQGIRVDRESAWARWQGQGVDRVAYAILRSALAVEAAKRHAELVARQGRERRELVEQFALRQRSIPTWKQFVAAAAVDQSHLHHGAAARAERGIRYREGRAEAFRERELEARIDNGTPGDAGTPVEQLHDALQWVRVQVYSEAGRVCYLDAETQSPLGEDRGERIEIHDTSERALRQMIAVAGARFGRRIELIGDDDFLQRAAVEAARQGIEIANPELQATWAAARRQHASPGAADPIRVAGEWREIGPALPSGPSNSSTPLEVPRDRAALREALAEAKRNCDLAMYAEQVHGWQRVEPEHYGRRVELRRGGASLVVERRPKADLWYDPSSGQSGDLVDLRRRETGEDHATAAAALIEYARTAPRLPVSREIVGRWDRMAREDDAVARRQREALAEQADLTERAIERQLRAMACERYEVGIRTIKPADMQRWPGDTHWTQIHAWTPDQLREALPWLRSESAEGAHIDIRPHPETTSGLVLIDDLRSSAVEQMRLSGYAPAVLIETSPDNYQAWVRLPALEVTRGDPRQQEILTEAARMLAQAFGGNLASVDWRQFGSVGGFTNPTERHVDVRGRYPVVTVHEWSGQEAPQGADLLARAGYAVYDNERRAQQTARIYNIQGMAFGVAPDGAADPAAVAEYRRIVEGLERQHGAAIDYSQADWAAVQGLADRGWRWGEVAAAMREASPDLQRREGDHAERYIIRTVGRAQVVAGLEARGAPAEHIEEDAVIIARLQELGGGQQGHLEEIPPEGTVEGVETGSEWGARNDLAAEDDLDPLDEPDPWRVMR